MYKSIMEIQEVFQQKDLKFRIDQLDETWYLKLNMTGDAATYEFLFLKSDDEDNDVSVRVFDIVKFPEERWEKALETINNLQAEYRFVRLTLDSKGAVDAQYDFPTKFTNIGEGAYEILFRMTNILDECYPVLMRAMWG